MVKPSKVDLLKADILANKKEIESEDLILDIHNGLMMNYGWIPLEEFKKLPIPTVINLLLKLKETFEKTKR